jgi:riboflavin biosynthesis pyrimidine reductase
MNDQILTPLDILYDEAAGKALPLPTALATLYGRLAIPPNAGQAHVIANFVTTLDGVVSLNIPGKSGGGEISGNNRHDRMVMGLLRAIADVVIVGASTARAVPRHVWTAEHIYPPLAKAYRQLRTALGKAESPLNVIVTASGNLNLALPVFQSGKVATLIITGEQGARHVRMQPFASHVHIQSVGKSARISARAILDVVQQVQQSEVVLVEGGAQLLGDFLAEQCLNELFLTVAPQIAGRDATVERPGLVMGRLFAPDHPLWGSLASVRRGGDHLFLRYSFETENNDESISRRASTPGN